MSTEQILSLLIAERDKLNLAIDALSKGSGVNTSAPARRGGPRSTAQRQAQSLRMKAYWAARRAEGNTAKKAKKKAA
jgi:hypothetical protein